MGPVMEVRDGSGMTEPSPTLDTTVAHAAARAYIEEATRADHRKHAEWALEKSAAMWAEYAPLLAALEVVYRAGIAEGAAAGRRRLAQDRAARSGLSKSERNRQRRAAIRSGQLAPSSHGTSGYTDGCRCAVCRDAHTMASKRRRLEVSLGMRQVASHGRTGFDAGCRCQVCASGKARSR